MGRLVNLTDEDIYWIQMAFSRCPEFYTSLEKVNKKLIRSQTRIKNSSAKAKGRDLQYWTCDKLSALLDIPFDQQDDDCLIHSREMSQQGVDVILRGDARKRFPFDIECKAMSTFDIPSAVKQAEVNASEGRIGMTVYRQTGFEPVVIFSWNTFADIFNKFIRSNC